MRSDWLKLSVFVSFASVAGCATSNAGKVCDPVASWSAPAYRCVAEVQPPPPPQAAPPPPKVVVTGNKIELKETIEFKTGSHELANVTDPVLDEVVQVLKDHPEITRIRIEGHTDSKGARPFNQKLSERRAATVKQYLANHGVEAGRMSSKGFGQERPIASNDTDEGRAQNRRVEIHIEERK